MASTVGLSIPKLLRKLSSLLSTQWAYSPFPLNTRLTLQYVDLSLSNTLTSNSYCRLLGRSFHCLLLDPLRPHCCTTLEDRGLHRGHQYHCIAPPKPLFLPITQTPPPHSLSILRTPTLSNIQTSRTKKMPPTQPTNPSLILSTVSLFLPS
jgi:hypothetical protein